MKNFRRPHRALLYYLILTFIYLALNMILPARHTTTSLYHLSSLQYHVLLLLVVLPVTAIWLVAFYGYSQIKEYAAVISETTEGPAFTFLADGLMWLAWGLPIPAIIGVIVNVIADNHPGFYGASVIISNYSNLIVPLVAMHILSSGTRTLLERAGLRVSIISTKVLVFLFVLLGSTYCYAVFHALPAVVRADYYLPMWLIILTVVVPYLYAWLVGLLGAYELNMVSRHSHGLLYKQALQHLSRGLTVIVITSIALQFLRSTLSHDASNHLSLGYLLIIIYMLLFVMGLGYAVVAYGARKLKRIEEV